MRTEKVLPVHARQAGVYLDAFACANHAQSMHACWHPAGCTCLANYALSPMCSTACPSDEAQLSQCVGAPVAAGERGAPGCVHAGRAPFCDAPQGESQGAQVPQQVCGKFTVHELGGLAPAGGTHQEWLPSPCAGICIRAPKCPALPWPPSLLEKYSVFLQAAGARHRRPGAAV